MNQIEDAARLAMGDQRASPAGVYPAPRGIPWLSAAVAVAFAAILIAVALLR